MGFSFTISFRFVLRDMQFFNVQSMYEFPRRDHKPSPDYYYGICHSFLFIREIKIVLLLTKTVDTYSTLIYKRWNKCKFAANSITYTHKLKIIDCSLKAKVPHFEGNLHSKSSFLREMPRECNEKEAFEPWYIVLFYSETGGDRGGKRACRLFPRFVCSMALKH